MKTNGNTVGKRSSYMHRKMIAYLQSILIMGSLTSSMTLWAQNNIRRISGQDTTKRPIITSVPFLGFTPDARAASLGDVGVATRPDINSIHWNNAKLAFVGPSKGVSLSYTPWLPALVNDMYITYLTGYYKIEDIQAIGFSLRYFNLGDVFLANDTGADAGTFTPRDFAFDATYSRKLSAHIGLGATMRFVSSNVSKSYSSGNSSGKGASGFAIDLGFYQTHPHARLFGGPFSFSWGAHVSNIGTKITYGDDKNENFMPTNLRMGTAFTFPMQEDHSLSVAMDLNKLLVPSPPLYMYDEDGRLTRDENGDPIIAKGKDPNRSTIGALVSSLGDAPGGFSEEIQEITIAMGLQYWYKDFFSVQTGYHYESAQKGNRKYFTLGAGFQYNVFGVDFAYLLPSSKKHPLAETLRFSLYFSFEKEGGSSGTGTPTSPTTIGGEQY